MTRSPLTDVGRRPPRGPTPARRWQHTAPYVPHSEPKRPSGGWNPRRLATALLTALVLAALHRLRPWRRPKPVMHRLVAADEMRFAAMCQQITAARRGAEQ